jgi:PhoPQ-activated pathogenicity-related protein
MPKLIFIGTNDEYWPVDAIKHYYYELGGENYIHYVPNAGHSLGDQKQAMEALSAFFGRTMKKMNHPECSWTMSLKMARNITLNVNADHEELIRTVLWTARSDNRDFRNSDFLRKGN